METLAAIRESIGDLEVRNQVTPRGVWKRAIRRWRPQRQMGSETRSRHEAYGNELPAAGAVGVAESETRSRHEAYGNADGSSDLDGEVGSATRSRHEAYGNWGRPSDWAAGLPSETRSRHEAYGNGRCPTRWSRRTSRKPGHATRRMETPSCRACGGEPEWSETRSRHEAYGNSGS